MSKQRAVNTKFWDDRYITELDPSEKLLFIYLLTNPLAEICGVYEIELRRMVFDTGLSKEVCENILGRFERDQKMVYVDGWLVIKNFTKHQKSNPSVEKGIERGLEALPSHIRTVCDSLRQSGTPNLTKLNLTKPNLTEKPQGSISFLEEVPEEVSESLSNKYKISPKGIQDKATDLKLYCEQKGKKYKNYKSLLENAIRKDKQDLQNKFPLEKKIQTPEPEVELTPEQKERNAQLRANIGEMLRSKNSAKS